MKIKNISKETQLVRTVSGKKEIKSGEVFEVKNLSILKLYKGIFEEIKQDDLVKTEEKKEIKKTKKEK